MAGFGDEGVECVKTLRVGNRGMECDQTLAEKELIEYSVIKLLGDLAYEDGIQSDGPSLWCVVVV